MWDEVHLRRVFVWLLYGLVFTGSLNWLAIGGFNHDLLANVGDAFRRWCHIVIGLAAIVLLLWPSVTWLSFLGEAAFPTSLLTGKTPTDATNQISVQVPPNAAVVYWLSDDKNRSPDGMPVSAQAAYDKTTNAGIVYANGDGVAVLAFRTPIPYQVPFGTIGRHLHYRFQISPGMLSRVITVMM